MLRQAGLRQQALTAYNKAVRIEPLFWPAVLNTYDYLREGGDEKGIRKLLDFEKSVGADYFASIIEMERAWDHGDLAKAANIGLAVWSSGRPDARTLVGLDLWAILLQLGYVDELFLNRVGPVPAFAPYLWRNDPKGLEMVEALHMVPRTFLTLGPLVQNAGRVYLLTGRSRKLADLYLSLRVSPDQFADLYNDKEDFLSAAPLLAVALKRSGHAADADALLSVAETRGKDFLKTGKPQAAAWLARIYAVQGRKEEALQLLATAISRNWLPPPPIVMMDLAIDPALSSLKGDLRFERLRQTILGTVKRERAQVNPRLLAQLKTA
jgi:tetratricopeptide (TPR) repeat protein